MVSSEMRELLAHLEWADAVMWTTVLGSSAAAGEARTCELLRHSHETEWAYLQLWREEPLDIPAADSFPDPAAIARWARGFHREAEAFVARAEETSFERTIEFPWADQLAGRFGQVHPTTLREAVLQVCLHSAYHRGQVNARLRELGETPPLVDFVVWIWAGKPAAAWPAGSLD